MSILLALLGIAIIIGLAYLMSNDKKNINYKGLAIMLVTQLL
ncbi:NupC/NupG family nucleoside CNT transporter, partial [Candidatus Pseudothioglobus singularis]|nr:NupC/NupG family nucleoside CNT transporter [Candidatus Pseudothioglobus singularis]